MMRCDEFFNNIPSGFMSPGTAEVSLDTAGKSFFKVGGRAECGGKWNCSLPSVLSVCLGCSVMKNVWHLKGTGR